MTSSPGSVLSSGYGSFSTASLIPTLGYGSAFEEPAGIGLATITPAVIARPPTDFVIHEHGMYRFQRMPHRERRERPVPIARSENDELGEMMNLYAQWKKAA